MNIDIANRETYGHTVKQAATSKPEDQMCPAHHAADAQNKQDMETRQKEKAKKYNSRQNNVKLPFFAV